MFSNHPIKLTTRLGVTLSVLSAFAGLSANTAHAQKATLAAPQLSYYGVYLQQAKLGSAVMKRDEHAALNGHPAVRVDMQMTMDLKVLGAPSTIVTTSISWSDPKTGAPLASNSRSEAAGRITTVSAAYTDRAVTYTANIQGTIKKETLTLKPGEKFLVDPSDGSSTITPTVGMKLSGKVFSGELMRLIDTDIEVVGQETVAIGGQAVRAYKILEKNSISPATLWANDAGDMLRVDMAMGMQMRREPREVALATQTDGKAPDIVAMTSIAPTGEPMTGAARKASSITYQIAGVTRPLAPDDSVQSATYVPTGPTAADKNEKTATVTVHPQSLPTTPAAPRFTAGPDAAPERLRRYLKATEYVSSTDPEFVALAHTIVGDETDTAKAAAKIAAYVHKTVKPDPGIAALRTSKDIRKEPRGVCRDYTTLFTAIARAAGIPTKQCVGLGYGVLPDGSGRFVGHAWPEVWVGNDASGVEKWVALEPTWGVPFADATHIKLAEGEITDFYEVAADMEHYKIKVLSIK